MEHTCNMKSPWPVGHPLPAEVPERLTGPELGFALYQPAPLRNHVRNAETGETVIVKVDRPAIVVRVLERSYVWSPGECRHGGGYRRYDWSVIEEGPNGSGRMVVDDKDLSPIPAGQRVTAFYGLR